MNNGAEHKITFLIKMGINKKINSNIIQNFNLLHSLNQYQRNNHQIPYIHAVKTVDSTYFLFIEYISLKIFY